MKELTPDQEVLLGEMVEREGLPEQSFSVVPIENKVNRIDIEIAGCVTTVKRLIERIRSLEKRREEVISGWLEEEGKK